MNIRHILIIATIGIAGYANAYTYTDNNGTTWTFTVQEPEYEWDSASAMLTGVSGAVGDVVIPSSLPVVTEGHWVDGHWEDEHWEDGHYDELGYWVEGHWVEAHWVDSCWVDSTETWYSVFSVPYNLFYGCSQMTSVKFPQQVSYVESGAFSGCTSLKEFRMEADEWSYSHYNVKNGLLYQGDTLYMVPPGIEDAIISVGTTSLDWRSCYEFSACTKLRSIAIPPSLVEISDPGYLLKDSMTVYFEPGDGLRVKTMLANAGLGETTRLFFAHNGTGNEYLELYDISSDGKHEWTVDTSVSHHSGISLKSPQIGDSQETSISFSVDGPSEVSWWWKISSEEYYDYLHCYVDGSEYTNNCGQYDYWEKVNISFGSGLHKITIVYSKDSGFSNGLDCGWVDGLIAKADMSTSSNVWHHVSKPNGSLKLTDVSNPTETIAIPSEINGKSVSELGDWLFECCDMITSATISNGVERIGTGAFAECSRLLSVSIPNSVTNIGENAFRNTLLLKSAAPGPVVVDGCVVSVSGVCPAVIELHSDVRLIAEGAFAGCTALRKIGTDPGDMDRIRALLAAYGETLASVEVVEKSVVTMDANGGECGQSTTTHVPGEAYGELPLPVRAGWFFTGWYTERDGGSLVSADSISDYSPSETLYAHWTEPGWLYSANKDGTLTVTGAVHEANGILSIPAEIDGRRVTGIGEGAFYGCTNVVDIVLPDCIERVGYEAFANTRFVSDRHDAFVVCGKFLLGYKGSDTTVTIPEGVEIICDSVFYPIRSSLAAVHFPTTLKRIGASAFYWCSNLTALDFPEGLWEIGDRAFYGCKGVSSIIFPKTIKRIGDSAFRIYTGYSDSCLLSNIHIEAENLTIGPNAFYCDASPGRTAKAAIKLLGSGIEVGRNAFYGYKHGGGVTLDLSGVSKIEEYAFAYAGFDRIYNPWLSGNENIGVSITISGNLNEATTNSFCWVHPRKLCVDRAETIFSRPGWLDFLSWYDYGDSGALPYKGETCSLYIGEEYVKTLRIPDGTTDIPSRALHATGLRIGNIILPESVKAIGDRAFATTFAMIQFEGVPPVCNGKPFISCWSGGYSMSHQAEWEAVVTNGEWNGLKMCGGNVMDYADALDAPGLNIIGEGYGYGWYVQSEDIHHGTSALHTRFSDVGETLICTVVGPAEVSFWWKLNGHRSLAPNNTARNNWLDFAIDGTYSIYKPVAALTNDVEWSMVTASIGAGSHELMWKYYLSGDGSLSDGSAAIDHITVLYNISFDLGDGQRIGGGTLSQKVQLNHMPIAPQVAPPDGYVFDGWSEEIAPISCPVAYVAKYRKPTAAEALDCDNMLFTDDISNPWTYVSGAAHCGSGSFRSGAIGNKQTSGLSATVSGPGIISFWCKVSSEADDEEAFDGLVFSVDGVDMTELIGGETGWTNLTFAVDGAGEHTLAWKYKKDKSDSSGSDCAWLDEVVWTPAPDPIPELPSTATADEIAAALGGSADGKLSANITDAANYAAYREWALGVKTADGSAVAGAEAVKNAENAWFSYALDADELIAAAPKEGDIVIDTFESAANEDAFVFTVKIDGIEVGDNALEANIRKVFDIEGVEKLVSGGVGFSSDNVEVNAAAPENGNVKFTVTPKMENGEKLSSFFIRVKMK